MTDDRDDLHRRIADLETRVAELEGRVGADAATGTARPASPAPIPRPSGERASSERPGDPPEGPKEPWSVVHIVDKIGIALLLLGVGFLLKYSYDQGWLTETLRVGLGVATGVALLLAGVHQRDENPRLSAVLCGGAIATFFGATFATHVIYDLIPASAALVSTLGVTMLSFVLAVRQDQPPLASIAAIGGFFTPFVLEAEGADPLVLAGFTSLVLLSTTAIYLFRGWRSLLVTSAVGGFATLFFAAEAAARGPSTEILVVVAAIAVAAGATAFAPVLYAAMKGGRFGTIERASAVAGTYLPILYVGVASDESEGAMIAAAAVVGLLSFGASRVEACRESFVVISATVGVALLAMALQVEPLAALLLGSATAFALLSRDGARLLLLPAYLCLAIAGLWTALLLEETRPFPFFNEAGAQMIFATAALVVFARSFHRPILRWAHYYAATAAALATLASQLQRVDEVATVAWGIVALAILVAGFVRDDGKQQVLGVLAVVATSAKLLLVDLDSMNTVARVGLFMAMGVALLVVSYLVPRWQSDEESNEASEADDELDQPESG